MPSTEVQNLLESIQISQNEYGTIFEPNHIAKLDSIEKTDCIWKEQFSLSKRKKRRWSCWTSTNTFGGDGTESLFCLHDTGICYYWGRNIGWNFFGISALKAVKYGHSQYNMVKAGKIEALTTFGWEM